MDRRKFLRISGLTFSAGVLGCNSDGPESAQRLLELAQEKNETVERAIFRHTSMDRVRAGAHNTGGAFPSYHISKELPVWDEAARGVWRLEVSGAVRKPLMLTLADLQKLPRTTQRVNHYCVEGWTAVAVWTGVRVSDVARAVQITDDADYVDFQSFDSGYHESWDIDSALHRQTLVAYGMDGALLSARHGAPARIHSPVKLGYKSTKYLTRIVFMPKRNGGYWTDRGYEWYAGV
ncbi:MAG TPA: molybdopterin-dependent oxidoreductase [Longimicrobiales bacterium]